MSLSFCSLASGSSGNSYAVFTEAAMVLVDAGISASRICSGLSSSPETDRAPDAILITHEHSDHIKGLGAIIKKYRGAEVCASEGTAEEILKLCPGARIRIVRCGDCFEIGDMTVDPFRVSHDASDPVGYAIRAEGAKLAIVTDTGVLTQEALSAMNGTDILVLEANHDAEILKAGPYPYFLKRRILGDRGHLSNEAAAEGIASLVKRELLECGEPRKRTVLLAHLSAENNFPQMALITVRSRLEEEGLDAEGRLSIEVLPRSSRSPVYRV